jgi:CDP-glucose 4,6-dehydratase
MAAGARGGGVTTLVTGAGGLIGISLCQALLDRGERVVAVRRTERRGTSAGRPPDPKIVLTADIREPSAIDGALEAHDVDTVFHLAAQSTIGRAARDPAETFEINVAGTWHVLESCRRHNVRRVVVASSDKVYGAGAPLPIDESQPLDAHFPYEASKAAGDLLARSYWHSFGLPVAVARLANVYGGGDLNFSRLVPHAVVAALAGERPLLRSDGSPERDFIYVDDAVGAYLAVADAMSSDGADGSHAVAGEAFNAGWGTSHSTLAVASMICRLAGTGVEPHLSPTSTAPAEPDRECVDPGKLMRLTGWEPRIDLEEGLGRTVQWYRSNEWARPA